MSKVNTHGLKIKGLRSACGDTCNYGDYDNRYHELFYDRSTGEVWTVFRYGNSWTEYHDKNVIKVCNTQHHMTMQEIADAIQQALIIDDRYGSRPW